MQNDAAVFRTGETLQEGCQKIDETVASFSDVKVSRSLPVVSSVLNTLLGTPQFDGHLFISASDFCSVSATLPAGVHVAGL